MIALRSGRTLALAAAAVSALSLLAGCGGSADDVPAGSLGPTVTTTANPNIDAAAVQHLQDLAGKWGQASRKITYSFTSTSGSQTSQAQVVFYHKDSTLRQDIITLDGGTVIAIEGPASYTCVSDNSGQRCNAVSADAAATAAANIPFLVDLGRADKLSQILASATLVEAANGRTIMGQATSCIHATGFLSGLVTDATWCFSDAGLLLGQSYDQSGQAVDMRATTDEGVAPSDLAPPYTVETPPSASATAGP
jgi:hypothetical protein